MHRLRILDYGIIMLSLLTILASIFWSASRGGGELRAVIETSGDAYIVPLSHDQILVLSGPVGNTQVEIKDGEVFISDSDCRDKTGVAMGHIFSPQSWVACLPNRVFVRVTGETAKGEDEVDSGAF